MLPSKSRINQIIRPVGAFLLVSLLVSSLTGCLVKKKDLKKISRTTDNLHIYQPGEYIDYDVTATRYSRFGDYSVQTGTLRVEWKQHNDLIVPLTGGAVSIPVIQEINTLNINGAANAGNIRYISQDNTTDIGQVTLHAIEAIDAEDHYWLNTNGDASLSTIEDFITFKSPMVISGTTNNDFYILDGCPIDGTECLSSVGHFTDSLEVVGDSNEITTNLGVFINPFQINFSGNYAPTPPTFPIVDIRQVCTEGTTVTTSYNGTMFVMPEIGMIQMSNTCYDQGGSGDTVYYTITLRSTNINLP